MNELYGNLEGLVPIVAIAVILTTVIIYIVKSHTTQVAAWERLIEQTIRNQTEQARESELAHREKTKGFLDATTQQRESFLEALAKKDAVIQDFLNEAKITLYSLKESIENLSRKL